LSHTQRRRCACPNAERTTTWIRATLAAANEAHRTLPVARRVVYSSSMIAGVTSPTRRRASLDAAGRDQPCPLEERARNSERLPDRRQYRQPGSAMGIAEPGE
jgi:hypothetical protein